MVIFAKKLGLLSTKAEGIWGNTHSGQCKTRGVRLYTRVTKDEMQGETQQTLNHAIGVDARGARPRLGLAPTLPSLPQSGFSLKAKTKHIKMGPQLLISQLYKLSHTLNTYKKPRLNSSQQCNK